jgi:hypothetical protein
VSRTMLLDHDEGNARSQTKAVETQHYQPGHGEKGEATHTQKGSTTQKEHTRTRHQHCGFPFCLDNLKYKHDTSHTRELRKHATALVGVELKL